MGIPSMANTTSPSRSFDSAAPLSGIIPVMAHPEMDVNASSSASASVTGVI